MTIAENVDVEFAASPAAMLELTAEWIQYFETNDPPDIVAGVDTDVLYVHGGDNTMYA